jgi:hypothetical protein
VDRDTWIMHEARMRQHTKDIVGRGTLKDGRLNVKSYTFVNKRPIVDGRVRVMSYNLISNGVGNSI